MARSFTYHTIESLLARCREDGDCQVWTGDMGSKCTPRVFHAGAIVAVRPLMAQLVAERDGKRAPPSGGFWATKCGTFGCVAPACVRRRTKTEHLAAMRDALAANPMAEQLRRARIAASKAKARKLTDEQIHEIRTSSESGRSLAKRWGVQQSMVSRYRRGQAGNTRASNPWAGLLP